CPCWYSALRGQGLRGRYVESGGGQEFRQHVEGLRGIAATDFQYQFGALLGSQEHQLQRTLPVHPLVVLGNRDATLEASGLLRERGERAQMKPEGIRDRHFPPKRFAVHGILALLQEKGEIGRAHV